MLINNIIERLVNNLSKLPSVGKRSALRIALNLLKDKEKKILPLIQSLEDCMDNIKICKQCGNFDVTEICSICTDENRFNSQLLICEKVDDLWAVENTSKYKGLYVVLGGLLNINEGMNDTKIGVIRVVKQIIKYNIDEVIIGLPVTIEGQTTSHYIEELIEKSIEKDINITYLARGIPIGGELSYTDEGTISTAIISRKKN